jgi:hypothetical protein
MAGIAKISWVALARVAFMNALSKALQQRAVTAVLALSAAVAISPARRLTLRLQIRQVPFDVCHVLRFSAILRAPDGW